MPWLYYCGEECVLHSRMACILRLEFHFLLLECDVNKIAQSLLNLQLQSVF